MSSERELVNRIRRDRISIKARLIENAVGKVDSLESMRLLLDALERDDFQDVNFGGNLLDSMGGFLLSQFNANKTEIKKQNKKLSSAEGSVESIKQMINQLGDQWSDRDLRLFIPEICTAIPSTEASGKAVVDWLRSSEQAKYPKIKNAFRLAAECGLEWKKQAASEQKSKAKADPKNPQLMDSDLTEIVNFI